jgi:hypothetical protein
MAVINVYEQYFEAEGTYNGTERRGALVMLVSDSEAGNIRYEAAVTFFPHKDEEDYAVSYDAYFSRVLYEGKGRRSRKKEQQFLTELPAVIHALAEEAGMQVHFERPLRDARTA